MILTESLLLPDLQERLRHERSGYVSWEQQIVAPDCQLACNFPIWYPKQQVSGAVVIQRDEAPEVKDSIQVSVTSLMFPLGGIVLRNESDEMDYFATGAFRKVFIKNGDDGTLDLSVADCREQYWKPNIPPEKRDRIALHVLDIAQRGYLLDRTKKSISCN